jgi:ribonuclease HI
MMNTANFLSIYTDGACSGNPGAGGWGVVLLFGDNKKELSGYERNTTNNRMELTAVISGLKALKNITKDIKINIYTDSKYICDAINKNWLNNWLKNDWKNSQKNPVANRDLWEEIIALNTKYSPSYNWVKGHSTNEYNNRCDEIATAEIKKHR